MSHLTSSVLNKPPPFVKPTPVYAPTGLASFELPAPVKQSTQLPLLSPPDTESDFISAPLGVPVTMAMPLPHAPLPPSGLSVELGVETAPMPTSHGPIPFAPATQEVPSPATRLRRGGSSLSYVSPGFKDTGAQRERTSAPKTRWLVVVIPPAIVTAEQQHSHRGVDHAGPNGANSRLSQGILMPLFPTMYQQLTAIAREFNFPSPTGLCLYLHVDEGGFAYTPRVSDESWQILWAHLFDSRSQPQVPARLPIGGRLELDIDLRAARWFDAWRASLRRQASEEMPALSLGLGIIGHSSRPPSLAHYRGDSQTDTHAEEDAYSATAIHAPLPRHVPRKLSLVDAISVRSSGRTTRAPVPPPLAPTRNMDFPQPTHLPSPRRGVDPPFPVPTHMNSAAPEQQELEVRVQNWRVSASAAATPLAATGQTSLDPANLPNAMPVPELGDGEEVELDLAAFTWTPTSRGPPSGSTLERAHGWTPAHTPGIDFRMRGSVCNTPSVMTSLGPEEYDAMWSPPSVYRLPSPDVAWRMYDDAPPTPSSGTSLGPADYDPYWSPVSNTWRLPSPDLAARMPEDCPPTPSTATSFGPVEYSPLWSPASNALRLPSPDLAARMYDDCPPTPSTATSAGPPSYLPSPAFEEFRVRTPDVGERIMPSTPALRPLVWKHVWPYTEARREQESSDQQYVGSRAKAAVILAPAPSARRVQQGRMYGSYPVMALYPAVYPHFDLYPAPAGAVVQTVQAKEKSTRLAVTYPKIELYPVVYPEFEIYPGNRCPKWEVLADVTVKLQSYYPTLDIYNAVYPHFDLYPVAVPNVSLTGAVSKPRTVQLSAIDVRLQASYPTFDIYPAVQYPTNLLNIYPSCTDVTSYFKARSTKLSAAYPALTIYESVYPHLDIYPGYRKPTVVSALKPALKLPKRVAVSISTPKAEHRKVPHSPHPTHRKSIRSRDIAPPIPVPAIRPAPSRKARVEAPQLSRLQYPTLDIYPAMYPHIEVYPTVQQAPENWRHVVVKLTPNYPTLQLYEPVYPAFYIYDTVAPQMARVTEVEVRLGLSYPSLVIYAPVYPNMDIFPEAAASRLVALSTRRPRKTHAQLHREVFPDDAIPALLEAASVITKPYAPRKTHRELHEEVVAKGLLTLHSTDSDNVNTTSIAPPVGRTSRARSGTITQRPMAPPVPSVPSTTTIPSPSSRRALPAVPPPTYGLPARPSINRMSMVQGGAPPAPPVPTQYVLPAVGEEMPTILEDGVSLQRSFSAGNRTNVAPAQPLQRSRSSVDRTRTGLPPSPASRVNRTSLVFERARAYDSQSSAPPEGPKGQIMDTLSQFPLPPLPPLPGSESRPSVQKLDRSKFAAFNS